MDKPELKDDLIAVSRLEPEAKESITRLVLDELKQSGFNPFMFDLYKRKVP